MKVVENLSLDSNHEYLLSMTDTNGDGLVNGWIKVFIMDPITGKRKRIKFIKGNTIGYEMEVELTIPV